MSKSILVVGGGFRSLIAAFGYSDKGYKVTIVEAGDRLGGFMSPIPWNGYWLDKGPQYFDNFTKDDHNLMTDILGGDMLENLEFKYATYIKGQKTEGYAIPDWRKLGPDFCNAAFNQITERAFNEAGSNHECNLHRFLTEKFGTVLTHEIEKICRKMLTVSSKDLATNAAHMVTFCGRALLFDDNISEIVKKSDILDNVIAGPKPKTTNTMLNLYPKKSNLEMIRKGLVNAIEAQKINVLYNTTVDKVLPNTKEVILSGNPVKFDKLFLGVDCRDAENLLFETSNLSNATTIVSQNFHFVEMSEIPQSNSYYTMNYSEEHKISRITNFYNYLGNDGSFVPVLCAEEPVSKARLSKNEAENSSDRIIKEICEVEDLEPKTINKFKTIFIPTTYKVPNKDFDDAETKFHKNLEYNYGDFCLVPSLQTLTRKQTLDDLRLLEII